MKPRACELCSANAAVFCPSDAALLCRSCDSKVHDANFLVARHIRQPICSNCNDRSENGVSDDSSACVSSTTSPPSKERKNSRSRGFDSSSSSVNEATSRRRVVDLFEAEGIFVNWSGKLGVGGDVAVRAACGALRVCLDRWRFLPFRVGLAASMWLGLRLGGERAGMGLQVLKRLEEVSGVPGKVILAAESKVARALRAGRVERRSRVELEEGWAEC